MVSSPQAQISVTHIQKAVWTATTGEHLAGYLTCEELDRLFYEVQAGKVQLWHAYRMDNTGNEHIATVCTRIETMYDGKKHMVLIHGGGQWLPVLTEIEAYLYEEAKNQGCAMLRAIVAREELAVLLKKKYGYQDFEYLVAREVR